MSSSSCETLKKFIEENEGQLRTLLQDANYNDLAMMNQVVMNASLHLPEAQTTTDYSGDPEVLLNEWVDGTPITRIIENTQDETETVERTSRYIEDLFGYRLPWITSALIRIAKARLDINDEDVSEYIRGYPSMVKHGLPDPVACWAMSAGIPTREVALRLAEAFAQDHHDDSTHEAFVRWLADLSDEMLRQNYGVSGYVLDDLNYKLRRVVENPYLKPITPIEDLLPIRLCGHFISARLELPRFGGSSGKYQRTCRNERRLYEIASPC